jgi:hypothetical protein
MVSPEQRDAASTAARCVLAFALINPIGPSITYGFNIWNVTHTDPTSATRSFLVQLRNPDRRRRWFLVRSVSAQSQPSQALPFCRRGSSKLGRHSFPQGGPMNHVLLFAQSLWHCFQLAAPWLIGLSSAGYIMTIARRLNASDEAVGQHTQLQSMLPARARVQRCGLVSVTVASFRSCPEGAL